MRKFTTWCGVAIAVGAGAASVAMAHPYGPHSQGDVMLAAHVHAATLGSPILAAAFLLAGIASHALGRRAPARLRKALRATALAFAGGAAVLFVAGT